MSQEKTPNKEEMPQRGKFTALRGNRRLLRILGATSAIIILAVAIPFYLHAISHESTDDAFIEAHVVSMSPRVAGHVARVLVEDNQEVKKGQTLAEIDPRDYESALHAAQARVMSAKAELAEAEAMTTAAENAVEQEIASLSSQQAGLAQVRAEVAEIKAGHDRDRDDLTRMKEIVAKGAVSRQEYDHAKAQEAITRAKLNSTEHLVDTHSAKIIQARAGVKAAEGKLKQAYAQVDARRAELDEAQADLEQARLNLSYTRITAPCDGHITKKGVEPGSYVQVGQKLFSIVSPGVWVIANFKETQITDMRAGQPVEIEVDTYPDITFKGHVDSIQRGTGSRFSLLPPENATGNFIKVVQRVPVKIVLDDPEQTRRFVMAPGMSVIPSVDISAKPEAAALQAKADTRPEVTRH